MTRISAAAHGHRKRDAISLDKSITTLTAATVWRTEDLGTQVSVVWE